jgi:hypothetical protein
MGSARAQGAFVIQPSKGVTQSVQVTDGCQSIAGNVSVVGGVIDFYITDPSGTTILQYENVSFKDFSVNTTQNGTYLIHLTNRWSIDNVSATLSYGGNFNFVFSETVRTWHTIATTTTTTSTQSPTSIGLISYIQEFVISVAKETVVQVLGTLLGALVLGLILKKIQKWKDGSPSKTPSTIRPPPSERATTM